MTENTAEEKLDYTANELVWVE